MVRVVLCRGAGATRLVQKRLADLRFVERLLHHLHC
jgi:hypothetical protein